MSGVTIANGTGANPAPDDKPTVLGMIRQLQAGSGIAKNISARDRQACVAHLVGEGYSVIEIAELLKVSEKTITRDKRAIQESNALVMDPALGGQMAGRLITEAELCIARIRRAVRDKATPPFVKVDAEHRCWQITNSVVHILQQMGFLPTATTRVEANLTHSVGNVPDQPTIEAQLNELARIQQECRPNDAVLTQEVERIRREMSRIALSEQIVQTQNAASKELES